VTEPVDKAAEKAKEKPKPEPVARVIFEDDLPPLPYERVKDIPLFKDIKQSTYDKMQANIRLATYEEGEIILREGDYSDAAFFILSGVVSVELTRLEARFGVPVKKTREGVTSIPRKAGEALAKKGGDRAVGRAALETGTVVLTDIPAEIVRGERVILETGELFGEISALSRYPASATVTARSRTDCALIRTPALRMMQRSSKSFKEWVDRRYRERSLANHLLAVPLFSECDSQFIDRLKAKSEFVSYEPGQVIAEQGTPAKSFLLVRGGYVKVSVRLGTQELAVTYLRKGDFAGEAALLLEEPWPYTLSALEHVDVVRILKEEFDELIRQYPDVQKQLWEETVRGLKERGRASRDPISAEYLQMAMETGLIHGESVLLIDLETCTRCDDCVRGCSDTHGGTPRFIREGLKYRNWLIPTSCYECSDPVCMIGCPTGAITRPIGSPDVVIEPTLCIGCGKCVDQCPWENIIWVEPFPAQYPKPQLNVKNRLATKCDKCYGRDEGPACVQMCPHGSAVRISFKDFVAVSDTLK